MTSVSDTDTGPAAAPSAAGPLPDLIFYGNQLPGGGAGIITAYSVLGHSQPGFKHWAKHSPTGVGWGYLGSGAADCARSLIAAAVGDKRAVCIICHGTGKIMFVPGSGADPRQALSDDPAQHVHDCDYCDCGLRIYPSEYQRFKEAVVGTWPDTFMATRKGIVGWLKNNFPDGDWPDIA